MDNTHPYNDPFLKGMIQKAEEPKAPKGFTFNVMRAIEKAPVPARRGFTGKQLISVILLGAAASITTVFMIIMPEILNITPAEGSQTLATMLPAISKILSSFSNIFGNFNISDLFGISATVIILLMGMDALLRSTDKGRGKHKNTLMML